MIVNDSESAPVGFCGRNLHNWQLHTRSQGVLTHWKENMENNAKRIAHTLDPPLRSVHPISQVILPVLIRGLRLCVFGAITIHT